MVHGLGDGNSLGSSNFTYVSDVRRWRVRLKPAKQCPRIRILGSGDIDLLERLVWEPHTEILVSIGRRNRRRKTQRLLDEVSDWCRERTIRIRPAGVSFAQESDHMLVVPAIFGRAPLDFILVSPAGPEYINTPSNPDDQPPPLRTGTASKKPSNGEEH